MNHNQRINSIDGLRAIAILLVVFYHAFYSDAAYLPYKDNYRDIVLFKCGRLGVHLFFLISGFVILMTLERTKTYFLFLKKRWIRLFPAMLIVSLIIYFTGNIFHERPYGVPKLISIIPGLLFINPNILSSILKIEFPDLETTFWSLYVETKFYLIFGGFYYLFGRKKAILLNFATFILGFLVCYLISFNIVDANSFLGKMSSTFIYFGWFTSGALAYLYTKTKQKKMFFSFLFTSLISVFSLTKSDKNSDLSILLFALLLVILFFFSVYKENRIRKTLENKILLMVGFLSYPFYLIHENMMISMIIKFKKMFPHLSDFFIVLVSVSILLVFSHILAKYLEPSFRKVITQWRIK